MFDFLKRRTLKTKLAGELYENELLLEDAKVVLEELQHRVVAQRSEVGKLEKRIERQRNELLVIDYQDHSAQRVEAAVTRQLVVAP